LNHGLSVAALIYDGPKTGLIRKAITLLVIRIKRR